MNRLICMSFDGETVTEGTFPDIRSAWDRADDMGSRWYFYPFRFVTSESGQTIRDTEELLRGLIGRRVKTVKALFKRIADEPESADMGIVDFAFRIREELSQ